MSLSQDIESRINIVDIVRRYLDIKKAGVNYKALCPFHHEKSPSFIISPQKNIAHCFACGKGGGPLKFLMEIEKIEFREAITILAKEAGIELKTHGKKEQTDAGGDIYALYRATAAWYHEALYKDENKKYLSYLYDRKISDEMIRQFQLGCSTSPRDLWYHLKDKGFTPQFLINSGIFISEWRDKFFGRIIFPITNSMGHTIAFTGRVLDDTLPKYLNSPASKIFDKSSTLYGFHLAKQSISQSEEVYIVEGQMDTIALHQAGVKNSVGISGTALTKDHIRILKRFTRTIYLCLDSDSAGVNATFLSIESLANEDIEVRIIKIPNGKDPDEFIKNGGVFPDLRQSALSPIAFYLEEGGREYDMTSVIGKKKLIEKCLSFLLPIKSQIEIDMYISEISNRLGVSKDAIITEYKKLSYTKPTHSRNTFTNQSENISPPMFSIGELLAGYIVHYNLFDLFSRDFQYTINDIPREGGFLLLSHVISRDKLDPDDEERIKIISLFLENQYPDRDILTLEKAARELIRKVHEHILVTRYKQELALGVSPAQILPTYIQQARSLGLPQSILRI